jgi:diadenosine tetraphosphate (Ap4A) HIT family hydrolase
LENDSAIVVYDNFPVSPGHSLVIPRQHYEHWFETPAQIQNDMNVLLQQTYVFLKQKFKADGFNVAANCGVAAGQSVFHTHFHIIPRYTGDHHDPVGGIRRILDFTY